MQSNAQIAQNLRTGFIYQIYSPATPYFYIGSTFLPINRRFANHKSTYKSGRRPNLTANKILKHEDVQIKIVKEVNCQDDVDLRKAEGEEIKANEKLTVNKVIAGRSPKEYLEDNKCLILAQKKVKITCDICDCKFNYANKTNHIRSKKHAKNLEKQKLDIKQSTETE